MSNTNENKRYLTNWNYNAALIFAELETIVKNNGGILCRTWEYGGNAPTWLTERKQFAIINRTLTGAINETEERIEKIKQSGRAKPENIKECENELERLKAINNKPIQSYYGEYRYISFVLDGNYYYYSVDDNPFFDFHFSKVKMEEGNKINRNYYCKEDKKEWLFDCFFSYTCNAEDRREAANLIFNMLMTANYSTLYTDKRRKSHTNIIFIKE